MTPRKKDQRFPKEKAFPLLQIAKADLDAAKVLAKTPGIRLESAGFYAHQAVEKALKAVLIQLGIPVPLVHDSGILVAKLPEDLSPPKGYELSELTPFATVLRYRDGDPPLSADEMAVVMKVADAVLIWAEKQFSD